MNACILVRYTGKVNRVLKPFIIHIVASLDYCVCIAAKSACEWMKWTVHVFQIIIESRKKMKFILKYVSRSIVIVRMNLCLFIHNRDSRCSLFWCEMPAVALVPDTYVQRLGNRRSTASSNDSEGECGTDLNAIVCQAVLHMFESRYISLSLAKGM